RGQRRQAAVTARRRARPGPTGTLSAPAIPPDGWAPHGGAVSAWALEPDVLAVAGHARTGTAPAAVRQSGEDGARHGPGIPRVSAALEGLPPGAAAVPLLRRRKHSWSAVLCHGA